MPKQSNKTLKKESIFYGLSPNKQIVELLGENPSLKSDLAAKLKVSVEAIRLWTAGYARPDISKLVDIAAFFGVSTDFLLGKDDCKKPKNQTLSTELGLSEKAIDALKCIKTKAANLQEEDLTKYGAANYLIQWDVLDVLNFLLGEDADQGFFYSVLEYAKVHASLEVAKQNLKDGEKNAALEETNADETELAHILHGTKVENGKLLYSVPAEYAKSSFMGEALARATAFVKDFSIYLLANNKKSTIKLSKDEA